MLSVDVCGGWMSLYLSGLVTNIGVIAILVPKDYQCETALFCSHQSFLSL